MSRTVINALPRTTQVKVMRRRLLQHDLDMYAAISGHRPGTELPSEPQEHAVKVRTAARARPWSPAVLASYLGQMHVPRFASRVVSPEVAEWMRRLSSQAMERIQEAQARLATARQTVQVRTRESA
ncbi:MAG TPA: hypothetical protein VN541_04200 [Tepidisphaeraceae bacterium]|nr:hypothetical protein [Tepidisphaeraceae bacterium]